MHQYKVNAKVAFNGDVWQWHQDYGTWSRDDLMPRGARDEHCPLRRRRDRVSTVRCGSSPARTGVVFTRPGTTWIPPAIRSGRSIGLQLRTWRSGGGIFSAKGKAGSVLMFHGNLVHASSPNMSPWGRTVVYLSLCHVDNHIRRFKRPEWIAHRDFAPIEPLSDNCLTESMPGTGRSRRVNLHRLLLARQAEDNPVRIGVVGCGKFASMFLAQAIRTPGLHVAVIADINPEGCSRKPGAHRLAGRTLRQCRSWNGAAFGCDVDC